MAGGRGDLGGGIVRLWELHDEFPEAVEYELIQLGLRWRQLGTEALTWRDLAVVVTQCPPGGALSRAREPENQTSVWTMRLLELIHYQLSAANVQRGNQSNAKRSDFPDLPAWMRDQDVETYGSDPVPLDEMAEFLGGDFLSLLP